MTRVELITAFSILIIALSTIVSAQDFTIGEVKLSSTEWGPQKASIKLTNHGEYFKIVVATAEVGFPGSAIDSKRFSEKAFIIEPPQPVELTLPFTIHGNIGRGTVLINLYDVVDTLDPLFESQRFFTREFEFEIEIPKPFKAIVDSGLQVPAIAGRTATFDNFFNRILIYLLFRGKSLDEIAKLTGVEPSFIERAVSDLTDKGLLHSYGTIYRPAFIVIENESARALDPIIKKERENIYNTIIGNLPKYDSTIKALASKGVLTNDANDALDGGSILYHKYPVVLGLLLWELLGKEFVNDGNNILVFEGSDPCRAHMGDYMHMVIGSADNMGTTFYNKLMGESTEGFYCGAVTPALKCEHKNWAFNENESPIYYTYNEERISVPLSVLAEGVFDHLAVLKKALEDTFPDGNKKNTFRGARFWCWGLVVDKLMAKFVENGILEKEGTGMFLLQKTNR